MISIVASDDPDWTGFGITLVFAVIMVISMIATVRRWKHQAESISSAGTIVAPTVSSYPTANETVVPMHNPPSAYVAPPALAPTASPEYPPSMAAGYPPSMAAGYPPSSAPEPPAPYAPDAYAPPAAYAPEASAPPPAAPSAPSDQNVVLEFYLPPDGQPSAPPAAEGRPLLDDYLPPGGSSEGNPSAPPAAVVDPPRLDDDYLPPSAS